MKQAGRRGLGLAALNAALAAILLAELVVDWKGLLGAPPSAPSQALTAAAGEGRDGAHHRDLSAFLARPVLDPARAPLPIAPPVLERAPSEPANLALLGIVASGADSFAVLRLDSRQTVRVKVGEKAGAYTVEEIRSDGVRVTGVEGPRFLRLNAGGPNAAEQARP